jgi:hypothetical protein
MVTPASDSAEIISCAIPSYSLHNILPSPSLAGATLIPVIGKMNTVVRFQDDHHGSHPLQHSLAPLDRTERQRENPSFVPAIKCRKEAIKQLLDKKRCL